MKVEILVDPVQARNRLRDAEEALVKAARKGNVSPELGSEFEDAATQVQAADGHEVRIRNAKKAGPTIADKIRELLNK